MRELITNKNRRRARGIVTALYTARVELPNLSNVHENAMLSHMQRVYLDNAAATPLDTDVQATITEHLANTYGNAGALHTEGQRALAALNDARSRIANALNVTTETIVFTSGGTEGNVLGTAGVLNACEAAGTPPEKMHVITTPFEHPSVLASLEHIAERGGSIDHLPVNENGIVDIEALPKLLREETVLVSMMYVNNEIGTIQPVAKAAEYIRTHRTKTGTEFPYLHTDASQAPLWCDCTPHTLGADIITADGQKIYGPKGIGFLYRHPNTPLAPIVRGGKQENGVRGGTENVPLIAGLAHAFEKAVSHRTDNAARVLERREHFIESIMQAVPEAQLNGDRTERLPNNVSITIPGIENEFLVIALDERGIACTTKSLCLTETSHTLSSIGKTADEVNSTIRFSLGIQTTTEELDYTVQQLAEVVRKARMNG